LFCFFYYTCRQFVDLCVDDIFFLIYIFLSNRYVKNKLMVVASTEIILHKFLQTTCKYNTRKEDKLNNNYFCFMFMVILSGKCIPLSVKKNTFLLLRQIFLFVAFHFTDSFYVFFLWLYRLEGRCKIYKIPWSI